MHFGPKNGTKLSASISKTGTENKWEPLSVSPVYIGIGLSTATQPCFDFCAVKGTWLDVSNIISN